MPLMTFWLQLLYGTHNGSINQSFTSFSTLFFTFVYLVRQYCLLLKILNPSTSLFMHGVSTRTDMLPVLTLQNPSAICMLSTILSAVAMLSPLLVLMVIAMFELLAEGYLILLRTRSSWSWWEWQNFMRIVSIVRNICYHCCIHYLIMWLRPVHNLCKTAWASMAIHKIGQVISPAGISWW